MVRATVALWPGAAFTALATLSSVQVWAQVDEIIVTTRYEEENLQQVPIAVTAIGADAIERRAITDLFKLAEIDPSVSFDTSFNPGDTRVAIRGLSNTRGRSNVAFLVDGVDVTSENQIAAGSGLLVNQRLLADVERIEIVKGPQSALYGRSAFAGAIAYTTKKPSDTFEGTVGANFAQDSEYQLRGSMSGPINDALGFRFDGVGWSSDGRFRNSVSGAKIGGGEGYGGALKLRWEPTDRMDLSIRTAYSEDKNDPRPIVRPLNDVFGAYPQTAIDAGIGVGATSFPARVGLVNHGTYCPDLGVINDGNPNDPNFANTLPGVAPGTPGWCQPGNMGGISDLPNGKNSIQHSEQLDGSEQAGTTLDLFRTSVNANWDTDVGVFSFIGGYTNAAQTDISDQDFQAFGRPDRLGQNDPFYNYSPTLNVAHNQSDTETDTRQLSGELRFATRFDGPVNATVGYLRWGQKVSTVDRNYIASCQLVSFDYTPGSANAITGLPSIGSDALTGVCDGGPTANPIPVGNEFISGGQTVASWQQLMRQYLVTPGTVGVDPRVALVPGRLPGAPWESDTDHQSLYLQLTWDISQQLKLTGEARWVDEDFNILRPNQSSCTVLAPAFRRATGGTTALGAWLEEGTGATFSGSPLPDLNCSMVTGLGAIDSAWALIEGSDSSDFIAPKATLEWFVNDTDMLYFSLAKAQKPGGISQLAAGGSAVTIENLRFLPEKMTTWELGGKSTWEAAGTLVANGAFFFNDYTDKQTSTQVLDPNGSLSPRVLNASSAAVWGVELDLTWLPAAIEGLMLRTAYTWQDATYKEFIDNSASAQRSSYFGECVVVQIAGSNQCQFDLSGNQLERQARNAFVANISYMRPLPDSRVEWFVEGDMNFTDKRYVDQDNTAYFDSYWLTNLRVGLQAEEWDVVFFVDNVLDDDTFRTGGAGPDFGLQNTRLGFTAGLGVNGFFAILPDPRQVGVRTSFRF